MLHLLLASDNVFTLSDRTEARLRAPDPNTNAVALDLDTLADARAVWSTHSTTYTLADMPRFTLLDYNGSTRQGALNDSLLAAAEWHSPRTRIRISERASYGQLSFESLAVLPAPGTTTAPPAGQPMPLPMVTEVQGTPQSILFASSETSVDSTVQLRPWTLTTHVAYQLSGGADSDARRYLPFEQGPVARATADFLVAGPGRDHLLTIASGSEASFSPTSASITGTEVVLAGIEEQWRHLWARRTETLLGAGWYAARTRAGPDESDVFGSGPTAEAAIIQRFARGKDEGDLRLDVRLAPIINPLTGLVDEQIQGTIAGRWVHRRLSLRAFASAAESLNQDTSTSVRLAAAEIDAAYAVSKSLTVDGGVRGLYQSQSAPATATGASSPFVGGTFAQVVVFFAVNVRALKVRF
jgi:hypothetical protein